MEKEGVVGVAARGRAVIVVPRVSPSRHKRVGIVVWESRTRYGVRVADWLTRTRDPRGYLVPVT